MKIKNSGLIKDLKSSRYLRPAFLLTFLFTLINGLNAQDASMSNETTVRFTVLLLFAVGLIVVFLVLVMSDTLIGLFATSSGADSQTGKLFSGGEAAISADAHPNAGNAKVHKLDRGFDIKVEGRAKKVIDESFSATTFSVRPIDFKGLKPIPKMCVAVGDEVKAGDHLFYDKASPDVFFCAPVSGEIVEIRRGEKRAIIDVVILADKEIQHRDFGAANPLELSREDIRAKLLDSGMWVSLIERPFGLMATRDRFPKAIHVSSFDSSPLAADFAFALKGREADFQTGLNALTKLSEGKVHLNMNARKKPAAVFAEAKNVQHNWFDGEHPAGMCGIQIHHIDPINKGDIVWTINPVDVANLGCLFNKGIYHPERVAAIAGPVVESPRYIKTLAGANLTKALNSGISEENVRAISGTVYTGRSISKEDHLGHFDHVVSVIKEGDFHEFMGWLLPSYARPSISPTIPWSQFSFINFDVNTNTHGEKRAFVVTGQYESVLPMDLYPQHLLKAIMAGDFDLMEGLGIYEVIEEDLAICEFVCTSKQPVQQTLRDGINYMFEQG